MAVVVATTAPRANVAEQLGAPFIPGEDVVAAPLLVPAFVVYKVQDHDLAIIVFTANFRR